MDKAQLLEFIERIEAINEQITDLTAARKDIMDEAKDAGFKIKGINYLIKQRKKDRAQREEERILFTDYAKAADLDN